MAHQQLNQLSNKVAAQQEQIEALQQALTSRTSRAKPVFPNPVKFDNKPYHFDTWLPSIKAKLRVDTKVLGDTVV
jgi:hypothetical protein